MIIYIGIGVIILFIIVGLAIANFSDSQLYSYYKELMPEIASLNLRAVDFCNLVSQTKLGCRIEGVLNPNIFGGRYLPGRERIELSSEVYASGSISAITICAHELGHAIQFYKDPKVLINNYKFARVIKFLGLIIWPVLISAIILFILEYAIIAFVLFGFCVLSFILALALKIKTIQIEKEASKYAIGLFKEFHVFDKDELIKAKRLLKYAKLTYVADFFRALLSWTFLTKKSKIF